jgi:hypothetical protein
MAMLPAVVIAAAPAAAPSRRLPVVERVDLQPLAAQGRRIVEALQALGAPLAGPEQEALGEAGRVEAIQAILDRHALLAVTINPEQRVKVAQGPARPELDENGWRVFLVKVINEAGTTAPLVVESPQGAPLQRRASGSWQPTAKLTSKDLRDRWLQAELYTKPPLAPELTGLEVEYRILQLYCADRDAGSEAEAPPAAAGRRAVAPFKREARLSFSVGQGTQDLGFRSELDVLFTCRPSVPVTVRVRDADGRPTMASLTIRDGQGRVYPAQAKRLAPDFFFHPQVYRADGESVLLPPGEFTVEAARGPEYLVKTSRLSVPAPPPRPARATRAARSAPAAPPPVLAVALERWIDLARLGWISGDHHIHAAGCAHYEDPSQGVQPQHMWRQMLGEDLRVGCALTWGPCYYYQKRFFTGKPDRLSTPENVMRYDVEVSGFSSHKSGHLVLLRLKDQDYPGAATLEAWPTLGLNVVRWAKAQGAIVGPAHSGWGLQVKGRELPTFEVPRFDGIGANEYVVQVTHEVPGPNGKLVPAIDFMSAVDTPYVWELNMWYHTLNAGFRTRLSGETDFPCIYGERVGLGRVYVKMPAAAALDYDAWAAGVAAGRSYVTDGRSHLVDFAVGGVAVGERGSELRLERPGRARVTARVAARLDPAPDPQIRDLAVDKKPYWHLERARIGATRDVPVEVVVNGRAVARTTVAADGSLRDLAFDVPIERSSWVALRILPSSHTNPVFVRVGSRPVRASRRSVRWCLDSVEACWRQKERTYRAEEREAAVAAYEHARRTYRRILAETDAD